MLLLPFHTCSLTSLFPIVVLLLSSIVVGLPFSHCHLTTLIVAVLPSLAIPSQARYPRTVRHSFLVDWAVYSTSVMAQYDIELDNTTVEGGTTKGEAEVDVEKLARGDDILINNDVVDYSWSGITVTVEDRITKKPKEILSNISGHVKAGNAPLITTLLPSLHFPSVFSPRRKSFTSPNRSSRHHQARC